MSYNPVAIYKHGQPLMVDYTPTSANVNAGDVIVFNDTIRVAHLDILQNFLGSLGAGGAVYQTAKLSTDNFTDGESVYWDATNKRLTVTSTNNTYAGRSEGNWAAGTTTAWFQHLPH